MAAIYRQTSRTAPDCSSGSSLVKLNPLLLDLCMLPLSSLFSCMTLHRSAFKWSFSSSTCPILDEAATDSFWSISLQLDCRATQNVRDAKRIECKAKIKQQKSKIRRVWLYFWIQTLVFSSSSSTLVKVCRYSFMSGQVHLIDCTALLWWCVHWRQYIMAWGSIKIQASKYLCDN